MTVTEGVVTQSDQRGLRERKKRATREALHDAALPGRHQRQPVPGPDEPGTGEGTVAGVIGGYQQGGDSPSVSYSIAFGSNVGTLYQPAAAAS